MSDEEEAYQFVLGTLSRERIVPYSEAELPIVKSVEQCINCGVCLNHCPLIPAVGVMRFPGPRGIAVRLSRSPPEFWTDADVIYLCTGCGTCREVCPNDVDIPSVVNMIRKRILRTMPDLVPLPLHQLQERVREYGLAFEPWEDPEDKADSRDMRLERLGLPLFEDRITDHAEVLYYPGCQAEERAQEIREAAKVILEHFRVDYTLLEEMRCCGLPLELLGDDEQAEELAGRLTEQVRSLGVEYVVTTCAGCTSRLSEIAVSHHWSAKVLHIVEYLREVIGEERVRDTLRAATGPPEAVAVHQPCHLIRHVSRNIGDDMEWLLDLIAPVTVKHSGVEDSCCGGGGLVNHHDTKTSDAVTRVNVEAIGALGVDRAVAPCPLCVAQLENAAFRAGVDMDVEDLTVLVAQYLSGE